MQYSMQANGHAIFYREMQWGLEGMLGRLMAGNDLHFLRIPVLHIHASLPLYPQFLSYFAMAGICRMVDGVLEGPPPTWKGIARSRGRWSRSTCLS